MKEIPLTRGYAALVDDADYEWLSQFNWCFDGAYAVRRANTKKQYLHRFIANAPQGYDIDHRDGNKLNNQRANLRLATRRENLCNAPKRNIRASSQYKGVSRKKNGKWTASITVHSTNISLGRFNSELDAARAYDEAARTYQGEFASTNF